MIPASIKFPRFGSTLPIRHLVAPGGPAANRSSRQVLYSLPGNRSDPRYNQRAPGKMLSTSAYVSAYPRGSPDGLRRCGRHGPAICSPRRINGLQTLQPLLMSGVGIQMGHSPVALRPHAGEGTGPCTRRRSLQLPCEVCPDQHQELLTGMPSAREDQRVHDHQTGIRMSLADEPYMADARNRPLHVHPSPKLI